MRVLLLTELLFAVMTACHHCLMSDVPLTTAVFAGGSASFDLFIAADVFVYIGDLMPVLRAAAAVSADR